MNPERPRIGLVLCGGGAKGAYQIGVWREFARRGLHFDVIAGTSIGALNAALVAAGDLAKAERFWLGLTTLRIARLQPLVLLAVPLRLFAFLIPPLPPFVLRSAFARLARLSSSYVAIAAVALVAVALARPALWFEALQAFGVVLLAPLAGFACLLWQWLNLAVLRSGTLESLLDRAIDWKRIRSAPPVWVTVAHHLPRRRSPARRPSTVVLPEYLQINNMPVGLARSAVAASMALPFGILPRVRLGDDYFIDGGVADNTPLYPLLLSRCDVIYVVHLTPSPREGRFALTDERQLVKRMLWLDWQRREAGERMLFQMVENEQVSEEIATMKELLIAQDQMEDRVRHRLHSLGSQIVHIAPRRRLGWWKKGTLVFRVSKTRWLMALGEKDASTVLGAGVTRPPQP